MLPITNDYAIRQTDALRSKFKKGSVKPLFAEDYLRKSLEFMWNKEQPQYPMTVKVPKGFKDLLKGDFEPGQIIKVDAPRKLNGIPVWFGDSTKGITLLGLGFQDGDSRKPSQVVLGDADIHALMAGATGQGKSVALESIISGIYYLYAPWSVKLTMLDAKIVSFKKFGLGNTLPHIESIGATGDVDFMISVLERLHKEMLTLNSVFAKAGKGDKISDFIEETGLTIPQNLIIVDEFTALLKFAGKKANLLMKILDDFARLGRNTGYHLLLSSQEFTSDVPDAMLNQIKVRLALGCTDKVSTKILGNPEAKNNIGKKGRLIVNLNPEDADTDKNMHFRVPFNPPKEILKQLEFFDNLGDDLGFRYSLDFYDEKSLETFEEFRDKLTHTVKSSDTVLLGEPSFAAEAVNGVKRVSIVYEGFDKDATMSVASTNQGLSRAIKMIALNYERDQEVRHNFFFGDTALQEYMKDKELPDLGWQQFPVSSVDNPNFQIIYQSFYLRKLILDVDTSEMVEESGELMSEFKEVLDFVQEIYPKVDSNLNRKRFLGYCSKLLTKEFQHFEANSSSGRMRTQILIDQVSNAFMFLTRLGKMDSLVTKEDLPLVCTWITGVEKIIGLGRIPSYREIEKLRDVLLDSYKYRLRFYLFTKDVTEIGPLALGCRYGLFEPPVVQKTQNVFKCADIFPQQVPDYSLVLFDSLQPNELDKVRKLKKVVFDNEYY